jgi:hypothetical protein
MSSHKRAIEKKHHFGLHASTPDCKNLLVYTQMVIMREDVPISHYFLASIELMEEMK